MEKSKLGKSSDGRPMHFSVGAIIEKDGKILLIDRTKHPLGFACPAGHMNENEDFVAAVKREVMEEVGLEVTSVNLVAEEEETLHTCKKGISVHYWNVFECKVKGEPRKRSYEANSINWYTRDEIKNIKLDVTWQYWFKKLGII